MSVVTMKQLLEAGVHFGHQTRRWNPKMAEYIYCERNGIYIIDLQKTVKKLEEAYNFVRDTAAEGGTVLFVGTKKQAADAIREEASRVGMFYVNARWLGGMLTNFKTMRTRIDRLAQLKQMQEDGHQNRPSCTAQADAGRRYLRYASQEGSHETHGRDGEAGKISGRRQRDEEAAERCFRC